MQVPLEVVLGPYGLTAALLLAVAFLGRLVFKYIDKIIADLTSQRDIAVAGWREATTAIDQSTAAINRLADALEPRPAPRRRRAP